MLKTPYSYAPAPGETNRGPEPDPRESEEWFQTLDPDAQDAVRQRWLTKEIEWERVGIQTRRDLVGSLAQGALLVGAVQLVLVIALGMFLKPVTGGMTVGAAISQLGLAVLVGMALGALWSRIDAGTLLCPILALVASFVLQWFLVNQGWTHVMALFCGPALTGFAGRYFGLQRDMLPGS